MSRNTAEALLLTNGVEGSYLLRDSHTNPGNYTVSVRPSLLLYVCSLGQGHHSSYLRRAGFFTKGCDKVVTVRIQRLENLIGMSIKLDRCVNSVKHFTLEHDNRYYYFGIGQFDSLEELLEHFDCLPVLGSETGPAVTLRYPYLRDIEEPNCYEKVVRHAVAGKQYARRRIPSQPGGGPDLHIASREGFLVKRGGVRKNWKKRWFTLQKYELRYYKEKGVDEPIRVLDMRDAIDVQETSTMGKSNCFELIFPWRTFYMYAGSPQEMDEWMSILRWKLDYYKRRRISSATVDDQVCIEGKRRIEDIFRFFMYGYED